MSNRLCELILITIPIFLARDRLKGGATYYIKFIRNTLQIKKEKDNYRRHFVHPHILYSHVISSRGCWASVHLSPVSTVTVS